MGTATAPPDDIGIRPEEGSKHDVFSNMVFSTFLRYVRNNSTSRVPTIDVFDGRPVQDLKAAALQEVVMIIRLNALRFVFYVMVFSTGFTTVT